MKILFVSRWNKERKGVVPFIKSQADSLKEIGVDVEHYLLGDGSKSSYFTSIKEIKNIVNNHKIDIIHSHFILSGIAALLASPKSIHVLSLMGSDTYGKFKKNGKKKLTSLYLPILTFLFQGFFDFLICKSKNIYDALRVKNKAAIIPNGVDLEVFKPFEVSRSSMGLDDKANYLLFGSSKKDPRKNFDFVQKVISHLNENFKELNIQLLTPYPVDQPNLINYFNVADVLVFTSIEEGSPNLIKEAMACNLPIVSCIVGDTEFLLSGSDGNFISKLNVPEFCDAIVSAISHKTRSNGREQLIKLGLDKTSVAQKLNSIYSTLINDHQPPT